MNAILRLRIALDFLAVALVVACLAYWWLENLWHELFGTALFALVITHNVFNRRWYGGVTKRKFDAARAVNLATIAGLAAGMAIMLVTSLLVSRDLFPFTATGGAFAVREIHMFAGYWVLLILALHMGTRWQVVMNLARSLFGISTRNVWRTSILRLLALTIALWGLKAAAEMTFWSKLILTYSLDMWDFNESVLGFFLNYGAIVGMFAVASHYGLLLLRRRSGTMPA